MKGIARLKPGDDDKVEEGRPTQVKGRRAQEKIGQKVQYS